MTNFDNLHAAFDRVSVLSTADEIAEFLQNAGIKGDRSEGDSCPLAVYFQGHLDGTQDYEIIVDDSVGTNNWREVSPGGLETNTLFECTPPMRLFIKLFDNGHYDELVLPFDDENNGHYDDDDDEEEGS